MSIHLITEKVIDLDQGVIPSDVRFFFETLIEFPRYIEISWNYMKKLQQDENFEFRSSPNGIYTNPYSSFSIVAQC